MRFWRELARLSNTRLHLLVSSHLLLLLLLLLHKELLHLHLLLV